MQIENCSKFWFQPKNERNRIEKYNQELNNSSCRIIEVCTDFATVSKTQIIAVRDRTDRKLYRARLTDYKYDDDRNIFKGTVCFIDTGRTQSCYMNDVYVFVKRTEQTTMPPRCFPCRLAEIQPSMANVSGGNMWDRKAIELFSGFAVGRDVTAEVIKQKN